MERKYLYDLAEMQLIEGIPLKRNLWKHGSEAFIFGVEDGLYKRFRDEVKPEVLQRKEDILFELDKFPQL